MLNDVQHEELESKLKVFRDKLAALSGQNFRLFMELDKSVKDIQEYVRKEVKEEKEDLNKDGVVSPREKAVATETEKLKKAPKKPLFNTKYEG